MTKLILPPALKKLISKEAFSDFRYAYSVVRGPPQAENEFQFIAPYIKPNDVVVEVGAGHGGGTLLLSSLANHVYSFEPNMYSFRILRHFTEYRGNVSIFNTGVGASEGKALLHLVVGEVASYASSIEKLGASDYRGHIEVPMVNLDSFGFPLAPTFLVVDCEGSEIEVLRGARGMLRELNGIFVETHILRDGDSTLKDVLSEVERVSSTVGVLCTRDDSSWVCGLE